MRIPGHKARLIEAGNGWFITYQGSWDDQYLLWLDEAGHVVRELNDGLHNYVYAAYAEDSLVNLVEEAYLSPDGEHYALLVHSFNPDGNWLSCDTLFEETLPSGGYVYVLGTNASRGELITIPLTTASAAGDSIIIRARMIRRTPDALTVGEPWNVMEIRGPVTLNDVNPKSANGPWGSGLLAAHAIDGNHRRIEQVSAFDAVGSLQGNTRIADWLGSDSSFHGCIDALASNLTVYICYTAPTPANPDLPGVYIAAFPLSEILKTENLFIPQPSSFSFSVFPNPFNAAASISFVLPRAGQVSLSIVDITGRKIATLADEVYSAGSHNVEFDASDLASGVYIATMRSGALTQSQKMVLLK